MRISDFLSPERVVCHAAASSKKRALEELSQLIAKEQGELTPGSVFDSLLARERLGGLGEHEPGPSDRLVDAFRLEPGTVPVLQGKQV